MRLTFTVDVPLRNPESVLDLDKLGQTDGLSYTLLDPQGNPELRFSTFTHQALTDHARLVSSQLQAKRPQIEELMSRLKAAHPTALEQVHKFPDGFGLRYPEHLAEYERAQVRFNSLHNETFLLLDGVAEYLGVSIEISALTKNLLENGFVEIKRQKEEIAALKSEIEALNSANAAREAQILADHEALVTQIRTRMNALNQMCDEKDVVIDEAQANLVAVRAENKDLAAQLGEAKNKIETKFKNADELSRYINSMLKDKRDQGAIMEAQSKEIADLKFKLELKEEEFKLAIQRNKEKFTEDIERERHRHENELFKLRDMATQRGMGEVS